MGCIVGCGLLLHYFYVETNIHCHNGTCIMYECKNLGYAPCMRFSCEKTYVSFGLDGTNYTKTDTIVTYKKYDCPDYRASVTCYYDDRNIENTLSLTVKGGMDVVTLIFICFLLVLLSTSLIIAIVSYMRNIEPNDKNDILVANDNVINTSESELSTSVPQYLSI